MNCWRKSISMSCDNISSVHIASGRWPISLHTIERLIIHMADVQLNLLGPRFVRWRLLLGMRHRLWTALTHTCTIQTCSTPCCCFPRKIVVAEKKESRPLSSAVIFYDFKHKIKYTRLLSSVCVHFLLQDDRVHCCCAHKKRKEEELSGCGASFLQVPKILSTQPTHTLL
jgi:hypothetical protein